MNLKLINSSDIVNWANTNKVDCQYHFPLLIRYLIRETITGINKMRFPAGDSSQYIGWDGILESEEKNEYIPLGKSYWEIGTGDGYIDKANDDFNKRTFEDPPIDIINSTFVFLTPRIWEDKKRIKNQRKLSKNDWIEEKKNFEKWKNIIVYDARDLEEWIEKCPNTGIWLSGHIKNFTPNGIESAIDFWNRWSYNPQINFTSQLILSGREMQKNIIIEWLKSEYKAFTLKSFTKEESIVFLISSILTLDEAEKNYFIERCLIISNVELFKQLSKIYKQHIYILNFNDYSAADYSAYLGNYVFIPVTPEISSVPVDLELGLLLLGELENSLVEIGFKYNEARALSRDSGRSLSCLRRLLQFKDNSPEWINSQNIKYILSSLLIGKWDENNKNDIEIITELTEFDYNDFVFIINKFITCADPPLYNIDNKWGVVSQYDLYFLLAPRLTSTFLDKFFNIAFKVLSEKNPEYFLDEDERWLAQKKGAIRKYSRWLSDGILNSILLISIYSDIQDNVSLKRKVNSFINKLLDNADEERWFSVSSYLPELAESSPEEYLNIIEESLDIDNTTISILFREGKDPFFSRCNYSGLLWSLELLAWNPNYLIRVTQILYKLSKFENIESHYANKPTASLKEIFLAWLPNTYADLQEKLRAINALIDLDKNFTFNFLFNLMPTSYDIGQQTYKPKWRRFTEKKSPPVIDKYNTYSSYYDILLNLADNDGILLSKIISIYDNIWKYFFKKDLIEYLDTNINKIERGIKELKKSIFDLITKHSSFPDAPWVIPENKLKIIINLYNKFPLEEADSYKIWLFDEYYPNLLNVNKRNHDEYESALRKIRVEIVEKIYKEKGLKELFNLANNVKEPRILGNSLSEANIILEKEEKEVIKLLDSSKNEILFSKGYCEVKIWNKDIEWINNIIKYLQENNCTNDIIINFLLNLIPGIRTWEAVESFNDNIQKNYWKRWYGYLRNLTSDEYLYGYNKLLEHERYSTALDLAGMYSEELPNELIVEILHKYGTKKSVEPFNIFIEPYKIINLFNELDKRNYSDIKIMEELEWIYIEILSDDIYHRPPNILHLKMVKKPSFYVKIFKYIFKPENDKVLEKSEIKGLDEERIKQRSRKAYDLIKSFKFIPGQINDIIEYKILNKWVSNVINLCKKYKRTSICEYHIGELLANSINNNILPEAVCKIIDNYKSKNLEEGFLIGEINKRGTFTKGMFEGGDQERKIAERYYDIAKKIDPIYQRSIKLITNIAKNYEHDANHEDTEAKQDIMDY